MSEKFKDFWGQFDLPSDEDQILKSQLDKKVALDLLSNGSHEGDSFDLREGPADIFALWREVVASPQAADYDLDTYLERLATTFQQELYYFSLFSGLLSSQANLKEADEQLNLVARIHEKVINLRSRHQYVIDCSKRADNGRLKLAPAALEGVDLRFMPVADLQVLMRDARSKRLINNYLTLRERCQQNQQRLAEAEHACQEIYWHYGDIIFTRDCADLFSVDSQSGLDQARLKAMQQASRTADSALRRCRQAALKSGMALSSAQEAVRDLKKRADWSDFHAQQRQGTTV